MSAYVRTISPKMMQSVHRPVAFSLQEHLATLVREEPLLRPPGLVGGIDVSYYGPNARAAVVVMTFHSREIVATATYETTTLVPYAPGLLAWRELPLMLAVLDRLGFLPDVLLCDAQGRAHPRRLGLASHLGVLFNHPTIGCAKTRLVGTFTDLAEHRGAVVPLVDGEEVIGAVVRTRAHVRPVYVSVGHRITLEEATSIVVQLARYRIPEPLRMADALARTGQIPQFTFPLTGP